MKHKQNVSWQGGWFKFAIGVLIASLNFKRFGQTVFLVMKWFSCILEESRLDFFATTQLLVGMKSDSSLVCSTTNKSRHQTKNSRFQSRKKISSHVTHLLVEVLSDGIQYSYRLLALSWQLHLLQFNLVWCQGKDW
jgi:hypothetical protein